MPLVLSAVRRMSELIDDIMDLARGRLGGGIPVKMIETDLTPTLQQVVDELANAHPDRRIETELDLTRQVECDGPKIAQLASNLLANAITHGAPDKPVRLRAETSMDGFDLSVENQGDPIPEDALDLLFQPFTRAAKEGKEGLGLGFSIAAEIAQSYGGTLTVQSSNARAVFKL